MLNSGAPAAGDQVLMGAVGGGQPRPAAASAGAPVVIRVSPRRLARTRTLEVVSPGSALVQALFPSK